MINILIPAKYESVRCPNKNLKLLKYTSDWLIKENRFNDAIVIYDDDRIKEYAESLGFKTIKELHPKTGDIVACYECAKQLNLNVYFEFPLTQPFRHHGILKEMEDELKNYDFVTTYQKVQDRSIFYVNSQFKFITKSKERKGSLCHEYNMLDGAVYLIKTEWVKDNLENNKFWKGNFNCVLNHSIFLDIDTKEDLNKFENII